MWNNKPSNNYAEVRSTTAKRILEHPLAKSIREGDLRDLDCALLKEESNSMYFVRVAFARAGTNCDLYIECEHEWSIRDDGMRRDEDGNDQMLMTFTVRVSWPSHGGTDVATCFARLELYREVSMLAAELQAELQNSRVWKLMRTKEEREKKEAETSAEKVRSAVSVAIDTARTGMRVANLRSVKLADVAEIPDGEYEHRYGDEKSFKLSIATNDGIRVALVTRLS